MKISIETLEILRTLIKLQPGIIIPPGNTIKARTASVYAEVAVAETFPSEVRIQDIHDFLRTVAYFKDPDFEFTDEHIRITESDGTAESVYPQAKPGILVLLQFPKLQKPEPQENAKFTIDEEQWATLQKVLGIRGPKKMDHWQRNLLKITSDGERVRITTERHDRVAEYSLVVDASNNGFEFNCVFDAAYLCFATGAYRVTVTPAYAKFSQLGGNSLFYFVGADTQLSTWGGNRSFLVTATKSKAQHSHFSIQAHSPEEAELLVRRMPESEFRWTTDPCIQMTFKAG